MATAGFETFSRDTKPKITKEARKALAETWAKLAEEQFPTLGEKVAREAFIEKVNSNLEPIINRVGLPITYRHYESFRSGRGSVPAAIQLYFWLHLYSKEDADALDREILNESYVKQILDPWQDPRYQSEPIHRKPRKQRDEETATVAPAHSLTLSGPRSSAYSAHYSNSIIKVFGRQQEQETLRDFLRADRAFMWFQISGGGGQGKSRLAWDLIQEAQGLLEIQIEGDWDAGFLRDGDDMDRFQASCHRWLPQMNTLIVFDYVLGIEQRVGEIMHTLASRSALFNKKVRLLLLERQPWNRGGLQRDRSISSDDKKLVLTSSDGIADWYSNLPPFSEDQNLDDFNYPHTTQVLDLNPLEPNDLIGIVRDVSLYDGKDLDLGDDAIHKALRNIDKDGRLLNVIEN